MGVGEKELLISFLNNIDMSHVSYSLFFLQESLIVLLNEPIAKPNERRLEPAKDILI